MRVYFSCLEYLLNLTIETLEFKRIQRRFKGLFILSRKILSKLCSFLHWKIVKPSVIIVIIKHQWLLIRWSSSIHLNWCTTYSMSIIWVCLNQHWLLNKRWLIINFTSFSWSSTLSNLVSYLYYAFLARRKKLLRGLQADDIFKILIINLKLIP